MNIMIMFFVMALCAASNGYIATMAFVRVGDKLKSEKEQEFAGTAMNFGVVMGIFTGTLVAMGVKDWLGIK